MTDNLSYLVGLIGWPVEHSVSPAMHNAAFEKLDMSGHYELLPTPPGQVKAALDALKSQGYRGANVTVPHKQMVMDYLDYIGPVALAIGAVNTIVIEKGGLRGYNTDGEGFLAALRESGFSPKGKRALVLGAGGAARAAVYALAGSGCAVSVSNRTEKRAFALTQSMQRLELPVSIAPLLERAELARFDLLVNTTPVGMWPHVDVSPWPQGLPMPGHWLVYDLVYNPRETRLLVQARESGAEVLGGLGMLAHQGALAFELWTGRSPPVDVMYAAAERAFQ